MTMLSHHFSAASEEGAFSCLCSEALVRIACGLADAAHSRRPYHLPQGRPG